MDMINPIIIWLIMLILFALVEMMTLGLTTIWFAGGALGAIIVAAVDGPIVLQVVVFIIISLVMLVFTRPVAMKYFNKDRVKTNAESLIGKEAIVTADIDNLKNTGKATVNGMEWTARAAINGMIIPAGAVVVVHEISGVKLMVEPKNQA